MALIHHNPRNPGSEIPFFPQSSPVLPGFHCGFLHGVLTVCFRPEKCTGNPVKHLLAFQQHPCELSFIHH
jgi:hypothetical protein